MLLRPRAEVGSGRRPRAHVEIVVHLVIAAPMQHWILRLGLRRQRRQREQRKSQPGQTHWTHMPTQKSHGFLYWADCPLVLCFRAASNSSPGFQVTGADDKACHPSKNPN